MPGGALPRTAGQPGARERIIALHCTGSSGRQWRALAAAAGGFDVEAPDLMGAQKAAPWPGHAPFSLSAEAAGLAAMLDDSAGGVHLVGHSYGGAVALRVALERPRAVASLTLFEPSAFHVLRQAGPATRPALYEVRRLASSVMAALACGAYYEGAEHFARYWGGPEAWPRMKPEARAALAAALPAVALHFHALVREPIPLLAYAQFRCPVLILRGSLSPAPARLVAELLAHAIPQARLRTLPGWDHMAPLTRPDDVAGAVAAFVESARGGQRAA